MDESLWWQLAVVFWIALCVFRQGALERGITGWRMWRDIAYTAAIVAFIFAVVSDFRGCSYPAASAIDAIDVAAPFLGCEPVEALKEVEQRLRGGERG